jgi:hypothetical protein
MGEQSRRGLFVGHAGLFSKLSLSAGLLHDFWRLIGLAFMQMWCLALTIWISMWLMQLKGIGKLTVRKDRKEHLEQQSCQDMPHDELHWWSLLSVTSVITEPSSHMGDSGVK